MMKATALSEPVPREKVHSTRLSDCEIMTVQAQRLSSRRMTVSGKFCASGTAQETYKSIQKLPKPRCQRNAVHSKGMQESKEFHRIPKNSKEPCVSSIDSRAQDWSLFGLRRAPAPEF